MKKRLLNLLNVILTTALLASILLVNSTSSGVGKEVVGTSGFGAADVSDYDPWADLNDDGMIDIMDIASVAIKFGATGTPINKTALLLELQEKIESLNNTIIESETTINYLNTTVTYLNETVVYLNSTGLGAPDYDSGWFSIATGTELTLTHKLNTTEVFVYIIGKDSGGSLHQYAYGSYRWYGQDAQRDRGIYWTALTETTIIVHRTANDNLIPWEQVRTMIWKIP